MMASSILVILLTIFGSTWTVQGRVVNNIPSSDNTITQQTYYSTDDASVCTVDSQGCSSMPCGTNAMCQETFSGRPVCSCPSGHSGNPLTYCRRTECLDHTECSGDMACRSGSCVNACSGTCGTNAICAVRNQVAVCSCPLGYKGDPFSYCRGADPDQSCSPNPCGTNAICQEMLSGRPVCSCPSGHSGNPLTYCQRTECLDHAECSDDMACISGSCVSPCSGACGQNAICEVTSHVPICSCADGYKGDPFSYCLRVDPEGLCQPSPCGQNTKCSATKGVPTCSCLPGFTGSPISGCRHECESDGECGAQEFCRDFKCQSTCAQCGQGATCVLSSNHSAVCECPKGYIGSPYTECRAECVEDVDCPRNRPACFYGVCKSTCDGACGVGADCNLRGLTPVCSCPPDMIGDPFISCRPFTRQDLCEPSPCGTNTQCVLGNDNTNKVHPVCTCFLGYTGDPLSHCVPGECVIDSECSDSRSCINYSCIDPCVGQCSAGATCEVRRHLAVCKYPHSTDGSNRA